MGRRERAKRRSLFMGQQNFDGGDNPREGTLKLRLEYLVYRHTGCAFGIKSHLMIANCKGHLIHILLHKMCEIQTTINLYAATKL